MVQVLHAKHLADEIPKKNSPNKIPDGNGGEGGGGGVGGSAEEMFSSRKKIEIYERILFLNEEICLPKEATSLLSEGRNFLHLLTTVKFVATFRTLAWGAGRWGGGGYKTQLMLACNLRCACATSRWPVTNNLEFLRLLRSWIVPISPRFFGIFVCELFSV